MKDKTSFGESFVGLVKTVVVFTYGVCIFVVLSAAVPNEPTNDQDANGASSVASFFYCSILKIFLLKICREVSR